MTGIFRDVFSKDAVNSKRQVELDIARGLAILFMIFVHVLGSFYDEELGRNTFTKIIDFLGCPPAAPVFMFLLGVGIMYSRKQDPSILFKRGVLIFAAGYLLNFLRGFLPTFIGSKLGYYNMIEEGPWYTSLVEVDILQFAGLAMIFISFLRGIKLKEYYYPLLAVAAGVIAPYVWGTGTGKPATDVFLATIFGGDDYIYHPFFSWIFYPLIGAFFGFLLMRAKNKNKFYILVSAISLLITIICLAYYLSHPEIDLGTGDIYNYFHHGILGNLLFGSFIIWWLAIWYFVSSVIPGFIIKKLSFWSKSVTAIYFIHWIIVGWSSCLIFIDNPFDISKTIFMMLAVLVATDWITTIYTKIKDRINDKQEIRIAKPDSSQESIS